MGWIHLARDNPVYYVLEACYDFDMTSLPVSAVRAVQFAKFKALAAIDSRV